MRPTYYRHLSLSEQNQLRFKPTPTVQLVQEKNSEGKVVLVKKFDKTKSTLKKRLEEKKKQKEIEKKQKSPEKEEKRKATPGNKKPHDTKSVKKTSVAKDAFSKSASKTKQSLKKSAKATSFKGKKDEKIDDMFVVDKESELLTEPKTKQQQIEEFKKFTATLPLKKEFNKGLKHHVASGIYDPKDKRKSGYFMRNASLLFDTFG